MTTEADDLCPICEQGRTAEIVELTEIDGCAVLVPMVYLYCDHCTSDFVGKAQCDFNYTQVKLARAKFTEQ